MFTGKYDCPAGCTYGIGNKCPVEEHSFRCKLINIFGFNKPATKAAQSLGRMIIGHDEDDIGLFSNASCLMTSASEGNYSNG
jgi:hypothetical protein